MVAIPKYTSRKNEPQLPECDRHSYWQPGINFQGQHYTWIQKVLHLISTILAAENYKTNVLFFYNGKITPQWEG